MKKKTAFITGIAGFAGSYLAEELLDNGYRVAGALYPGESTKNIDKIKKGLTLLKLDILNQDKCNSVTSKIKPDFIFHLAAMASVGKSFSMERMTYRVNIEGTLNILQAAKYSKKPPKVVFVSSSDCYGIIKPKSSTVTENNPLNPISPYGISKVTAEQLSHYYYRQFNIPVLIARSFNHCGPRQAESFVVPDFAKQVAEIELGIKKPVMSVGDLSTKRDLSDVRDIVRGYRLMAEKGKPGRVYQLCSGKAIAISSVLKTLTSFSSKKIDIEIDKNRFRKNDIPVLRGSNKRAVQELGFKSRYKLKESLSDTYEYWLNELSSQKI